MPDENKNESTEAAEAASEAAAEEANSEAQEDADGADGEGDGEGTPDENKLSYEDLETELAAVRREAAARRVAEREAKEALAKAKTPEEFESAVRDRDTKIAELEHSILVGNAARKYKLPDELVALLDGENEQAIEEKAKTLAKYAGRKAPEQLKGGVDPTNEPDDEINIRAIQKSLPRRY